MKHLTKKELIEVIKSDRVKNSKARRKQRADFQLDYQRAKVYAQVELDATKNKHKEHIKELEALMDKKWYDLKKELTSANKHNAILEKAIVVLTVKATTGLTVVPKGDIV